MLLAAPLSMLAQPRQEMTLSENWSFSHDKKTWQSVSVPHDWAIAGPFNKKWDLQKVAIVQNGETEATEKSGRSGALPDWQGPLSSNHKYPQKVDACRTGVRWSHGRAYGIS